jgi:long-chain acyl-CoA synthetase
VPAPPDPGTIHDTLPRLLLLHAERQPRRTALRRKHLGLWRRITWRQEADRVRALAGYLLSLGLERGDRVGLLGENRPEWLHADLAIQAAGGVSAAIYPTSGPEPVEYVLAHSEARAIVVEDGEQLEKVLEVRSRLKRLEAIVVMEPEGLRGFADPMVLLWEPALSQGAAWNEANPGRFEERLAEGQPDDLALLIYTSGTTGPPKGAMLTHRNLIWTTGCLVAAFGIRDGDEVLSFLPLSHIAERLLCVAHHATVGLTINFMENLDTLPQNLAEVAPTVIFAVPRIWEKFHSTVTLRMDDADWFKRAAYAAAVAAGRRKAAAMLAGRRAGLALEVAYPLVHFAVLLPLKRKLGLHRARVVLSGAAPIAPSILEFFLGLGVPIREIYGQTEGSGPTCANQERIKLGTVGPPLPGIEVKIAPDGEILVRGPNVFQGYYRDPEATAATLREGWLHSGDIGVLDEDGFLRITDRKKDLIITAGGKNVAPQFLENKLKASPYINDAVVIGDGLKYLTALIVIDEDNVAKWASDQRIPFTTFGDLAANEQVEGLIAREVEAVNATLSRAEEVKRFALLPRRLHQEDGDVTPTLKVKRAAVMQKYADLIGSLYSDTAPRRARAAGN